MKNYHLFLEELEKVWRSCYKVLKPGRQMVIWVHDIFQFDKKGIPIKLIPFHQDIIKSTKKYFVLKNIIIWDRYLNRNNGPLIVKEQGNRFQYIIVLQKKGHNRFQQIDIRNFWLPIWNLKTQPKLLGSKFFYKIIFALGKIGILKKIFNSIKNKVIYDKYQFKDYLTECPEEAPEWAIRNFSFAGETVLDPFVGSGTSLKVAQRLGRQGIGFDINKNVIKAVRKKIPKNLEIITRS